MHGPDQRWGADISYVAIAVGFVYLAGVLDAWSRRWSATPSLAGSTRG